MQQVFVDFFKSCGSCWKQKDKAVSEGDRLVTKQVKGYEGGTTYRVLKVHMEG